MMDEQPRVPKGRPVLKEDMIKTIVECRKIIAGKTNNACDRSKFKTDNGQHRRTLELKSDGFRLRMVIRQLVADPFDYSVILLYTDEDGYEYIIKRYNGDHGTHINPIDKRSFSGTHIHTITEWCQIHTHKGEGEAQPTDRYRTLQEAVSVFMSDLNIHYEHAINNKSLEEYM